MKHKPEVLKAMEMEISQRGKTIDKVVSSLYFGGGTPSILEEDELRGIFSQFLSHFQLANEAEVTLECNPDDINPEKLRVWRNLGVNRLSIGIQTFDDKVLSWMNRSHDSNQAIQSVQWAQEAGFDNITVDLIYGIPGMDIKAWAQHVEKSLSMGIQHISCYCLTVEYKTLLDHLVNSGEVVMPAPEESAEQFLYLIDRLAEAGFEQYEVSNFAQPGFVAVHNSSYWKGGTYLGIGPSAHSFDGRSRFWNVASNAQYMRALKSGESCVESEDLSISDRINEYLMTGLRTKWGIDPAYIKSEFHYDINESEKEMIESLIGSGLMFNQKGKLILSPEGLLQADRIASDLFVD